MAESIEIQRATGTGPKTTILRLKGPLTLATLFDFQTAVRQNGTTDTILDLIQVPYIDSAGLGAILAHWAHTQRSKDKFAVVGANERVQVLFKITKVDGILPIFPSTEEAEQSF
jgi:anti-sigma B factor antagonist